MADPSSPFLLDALSRAASAPDGLPLLTTRLAPGLFPASGPGRKAAQHACDDGLLRVVRTERKGKSVRDVVVLTEAGLGVLLRDGSPKRVLQQLIEALHDRGTEMSALVGSAERMQAALEVLKNIVEKAVERFSESKLPMLPTATGTGKWLSDVVNRLADRQASDAAGDCSLPELYRHARASTPGLSIGSFHDGLRKLLDDEKIYLHPWTGPLYELPEPNLALLVGHEIAYYASYREPQAPASKNERFALAAAAGS